MSRKATTGFTLIELMIVVIILGVLAAIAVPSFLKPYHYSKTSEAYALLRDIGAKQEAYKAEFGMYLDVSGSLDWGDKRPAVAPTTDFGWVAWDAGDDEIGQRWNQLGFRPQSAVRFGYAVTAGQPGGAAPALPDGANAIMNPNDHWWVAVAFGNVNASGASGASDTSRFYLSHASSIIVEVNEGN